MSRGLLAALAVSALAPLGLPAFAAKSPAPAFAVGILPGAGNQGANRDGEPALAATPDGVLWAVSNVLARGCGRSLHCGVDVWRSRNGGRSWEWVANPFRGVDPSGSYTMGGGDSDLAVASAKNAAGYYNVYVTSRWIADAVAVSRDSGKTWEVQPVESPPGTEALEPDAWPTPVRSSLLPGTVVADRPWVGAIGACTVYLAYNESPSNVTVFQRYDACQPVLTPTGATLPFLLASNAASYGSKVSGRFVVDTAPASPHAGAIYYPAVIHGQVVVQVSTDGVTWTPRPVAAYPTTISAPIWPVTAATDAAGRLYVAWHGDGTAYVAASADAGATWTAPRRLNPPGTSAIFPTVAAGPSGAVAVLWYGTDRATPPVWRVYEARSADAGRTWTSAVARTGPIHRGVACVYGSNCTVAGSRNLLDDFGAVMVPGTSRVVAVYTTDQPGGASADRKTGYFAEL